MFVRSKLKASVTTYKARSSGAKPTPQERFLVVPCAFQFSRRVSRARYSLAVDVFKFQRGVIPIQEREVRLKRVERHERRESLNSLSPTCLHPCPREGFVLRTASLQVRLAGYVKFLLECVLFAERLPMCNLSWTSGEYNGRAPPASYQTHTLSMLNVLLRLRGLTVLEVKDSPFLPWMSSGSTNRSYEAVIADIKARLHVDYKTPNQRGGQRGGERSAKVGADGKAGTGAKGGTGTSMVDRAKEGHKVGADGKAGTGAKGGNGMSMVDRGKEGGAASAKVGADGKAGTGAKGGNGMSMVDRGKDGFPNEYQ
ncbi:hypothetical protein NFJ02_41g108210 [Pycnococcus provasolii]